jgi:DNA repair photolyase
MEVVYEHTNAKRMLHYVNVWFLPFRWGANTYRGCAHNCVYCNVRYTHEYLGLETGEFAHRILVKDNAAQVLDRELSRPKWKHNLTVNLATVTDPYQPAEHQFHITQQVLDVFLKHHNALMVTTKSDLILRDLDLLTQIAQTGFLNVVITLPTLNEDLRKRIEPNAPSVEKRLQVIQTLHEAGITTGVTAIPILPYITDRKEDIHDLIRTIANHGADYVIVDVLNFRGEVRTRFYEFLKAYDPNLIPQYNKIYQTNYCAKSYAKRIRQHANAFIKQYQVNDYNKMYSYRKGHSKER